MIRTARSVSPAISAGASGMTGRAITVTIPAMIKKILTVGGYTLLSRLTGFMRDIMLAAILGAGPTADAFFVAFRLPNHFRAIFAEGAFNAAFIPAYARIRTQERREGGGCVRRPYFHAFVRLPSRAAGAGAYFHPAGDRAAGAGLFARAASVRAGGFADADHFSLSSADHAGDAVGRHSQCAAPVCGGGRGADPAQRGDDGDAALAVCFPAPAMPRLGAC